MKIFIFIFHKDRFDYLDNLLTSIKKNLKLPKISYEIIIHDASKKWGVKNKLKELDNDYKIILENKDKKIIHNHLGGLYDSMNIALDYSLKNDGDFMLFLQDDMQFVSGFDMETLNHIKDIFEKTNVAYINNTFVRLNKVKTFNKFVISKCRSFYYNLDNSYNDTGIFCLKALKKFNFKFKHSENENELFFKGKNINAANLKNPFVSYIPWPKTTRRSEFDKFFITRNIKKILTWINGKGIGAGVNQVELKDLEKFLNRDIKILPVAEIFLKTKRKLLIPWSYEPYFDFKKVTSFNNLVRFDWIFNGNSDYINLTKDIQKEILNINAFKIEN